MERTAESTDFKPDLTSHDVYADFERTRNLDDQKRIPLSGINLSGADLSDACLHTPFNANGADLRRANLWHANLSRAELPNARLEHSKLQGAVFRDADLRQARFHGSRMASTSLVGADLFQANFAGVTMNNAVLSRANLSNADLEDSDLTKATMVGADLGCSHPWEAKLFRVFVVEPQQSFERIRAQAGAFLVSAFHERFERAEILKWNPDIPVYGHCTYLIPDDKRQGILEELRLVNVSRESLLPGLAEAANAVTSISRTSR